MINSLKFMQRFNKGNYEHEEYTVEYSVDESECPVKTMQNMKHKTIVKENGEKRDAEMVAVEVEEEPVKEVETMKQFNKEVNPKPPKKKRRAPEHRKEMAAILNKEVPEWKASKESTIQAKGLSEVLAGKDFLDGKTGEVLPSFIELIVKGMEISDEL